MYRNTVGDEYFFPLTVAAAGIAAVVAGLSGGYIGYFVDKSTTSALVGTGVGFFSGAILAGYAVKSINDQIQGQSRFAINSSIRGIAEALAPRYFTPNLRGYVQQLERLKETAVARLDALD